MAVDPQGWDLQTHQHWKIKFANSYKDPMLQVIQLLYLNFLCWHDSNIGFCMLTYWYSWCDISTNQQFLMNHFTGIKLEHECGENPYDAVSFAVKSALYATQIPSIKISTMDGYQHGLEVFNNMVYIIAKCLPYIILILRLIVVEKLLEEECGRRVFWPQPEFCHLQRPG